MPNHDKNPQMGGGFYGSSERIPSRERDVRVQRTPLCFEETKEQGWRVRASSGANAGDVLGLAEP